MLRKILLVISVSVLCVAGVIAQGTSTSTTTTTNASSTDKPKKPVFRSTKDQVKEAQTMLKAKNLYSGEATGVSSPEWKAAVKTFQGENGLSKTGSLNRATLEKLGIDLTEKQKLIPVSPSSFAKPATPKEPKPKTVKTTTASTTSVASTSGDKPKKPAPFRATPDQVKAAQKMLKDGKMYAGEETGKLDDATRDGLKKYQEANGVKVTGTLNAVTLEKMGIALTDKQKADAAAAAAAMPKN